MGFYVGRRGEIFPSTHNDLHSGLSVDIHFVRLFASIMQLVPQIINAPGARAPDNEKPSHTSDASTEVTETSNKILDIIFEYALNKVDDSANQLAAGRPKFLSVIGQFVIARARVDMCLPGFPFKSANKVEKVLGTLPDKAEELALERLNTICVRIGGVYPPGAQLTIISDGLVYNGWSKTKQAISFTLSRFANIMLWLRQTYWVYRIAIPGLMGRFYGQWLFRKASAISNSPDLKT